MIQSDGAVAVVVHLMRDGRLACMPGLTELHATSAHPHFQRTGEVQAVTCVACRRAAGEPVSAPKSPAR